MRYEDYFSHGDESDSIPLTLVAEVVKLYKGNLKSTIIKLGGDDGMSCRRYVENFKIGQYYFIQYDYEGMYGVPEISSCGETFVEINKDEIVSQKQFFFDTNYVSSTSVENFENKIIDALGECVNINLNPQENIVKQLKPENCTPKATQSPYIYGFLLIIVLLLGVIFFRKRMKK